MIALSAAWPALTLVCQRPIAQAEVAGLAPDPTVLLTQGLLLVLRLPRRWSSVLLLAPLVWCCFSGATLWALGTL